MAQFLDYSGLSNLVDSFKDDITASSPVYFGKLDVVSSDESDDIIVTLEGTSNSDLATVIITVTCNDDADVTIKVEAA